MRMTASINSEANKVNKDHRSSALSNQIAKRKRKVETKLINFSGH